MKEIIVSRRYHRAPLFSVAVERILFRFAVIAGLFFGATLLTVIGVGRPHAPIRDYPLPFALILFVTMLFGIWARFLIHRFPLSHKERYERTTYRRSN